MSFSWIIKLFIITNKYCFSNSIFWAWLDSNKALVEYFCDNKKYLVKENYFAGIDYSSAEYGRKNAPLLNSFHNLNQVNQMNLNLNNIIKNNKNYFIKK